MIRDIIITIAAIWIFPAVFYFGYLQSNKGRGSSRWWVNLLVSLGWPLALAFARYLKRYVRRMNKR